ncbi:hypothetical protein FBY13_10623 [Pantoea sp. SJZ147]|nr:hypothetical protein FBY13_10623 [Pantoea sp. SJZ147]
MLKFCRHYVKLCKMLIKGKELYTGEQDVQARAVAMVLQFNL